MVLAMLGCLLPASCVANVDHGDTVFACSDGECPSGYSCEQAMCVVPGMSSDAAPVADAGSPDANLPDAASCDDLFGLAPGYQLCSEDALSCSFNVNLAGETCTTACQLLETTCVGAFDNAEDLCVPIEATGDTCDTPRATEICICARPVSGA